MNPRVVRDLLVSMLTVLSAMVLGAIDGAADQVRVGASLPLTGPLASYGHEVESGLRQAVEDLNHQGGVLGKSIDLVIYDDRRDPASGQRIAVRLADVDKVVAVIGPVCSSVAFAALSVLSSSGSHVVVILSSATASGLTEQAYSNVFRIVPRADLQSPIIGVYLQSLTGYNIAVLNDGSAYAHDVNSALDKSWPTLKSDVKFQAEFPPTQTDFTPIVQQLRASDITALFERPALKMT